MYTMDTIYIMIVQHETANNRLFNLVYIPLCSLCPSDFNAYILIVAVCY